MAMSVVPGLATLVCQSSCSSCIAWASDESEMVLQELSRENGSQGWAGVLGVTLHCCCIGADRPSGRSS